MNQTGENNPNWKGGRVVDPRGYVLIRVGVGHHLADVRGYAYEHRLIAEKKLGRRLKPGERARRHPPKTKGLRALGESNQTIKCACGCGAKFDRFDTSGRPRRFVSGHNTRGRHG